MADPASRLPPVEPIDSGLRCPVCDYNLTGLSEHRCPECGREFDAEVLRRALDDAEVQPATPWDTDGGWRGFWRMWWLAWRYPERLANAFPLRHHRGNAWLYSLWCYTTASIMVAFGLILHCIVSQGTIGMAITGTVFVFVVSVCTATAFIASETLIALVLSFLVRPRRGARSYHFWRGVTHYTSGHTLFTACWCIAMMTLGWILRTVEASQKHDIVTLTAYGLAFLIFVDWLRALLNMVAVRGVESWRAFAAFPLILVIGLGGIVLGVYLPAGLLFSVLSL